MLKKHLNKEPSGPYIMSMTPSSQADNFRMQHLDYSSTVYDDTVVRPTVDKCLENFKKLKRKYVDLERAHILLQAKLKYSEDVKSSENETSDSEESQSGDESDEVHSESKKPGSTRLAKIMPAFKRLKTMPSSIQKKFIDTCHNDLIRCIGSCTRHIINGKAKLTPAEVKQLRRRKQMVKSLARKNTSLKTKRKILQTGGFLGLILPSVVSLMTSILKNNESR